MFILTKMRIVNHKAFLQMYCLQLLKMVMV